MGLVRCVAFPLMSLYREYRVVSRVSPVDYKLYFSVSIVIIDRRINQKLSFLYAYNDRKLILCIVFRIENFNSSMFHA